MNKWLVSMSAAAVAAGAMAVESQNIVGVDNSNTASDGYNFVTAPFGTVGQNLIDINGIQVPGAEWLGGICLWDGNPTVVSGTEFIFVSDGEKSFWSEDMVTPASFSIDPGQGVILENVADCPIQYSGEVPSDDVTFTLGTGYAFVGNPFPEEIDIQDVQVPGAEWIGGFCLWDGNPTVVSGTEFMYIDDGVNSFWSEDMATPVEFPIQAGQAFILENCDGLTVTINKPY
jgi:hypothetical protein